MSNAQERGKDSTAETLLMVAAFTEIGLKALSRVMWLLDRPDATLSAEEKAHIMLDLQTSTQRLEAALVAAEAREKK